MSRTVSDEQALAILYDLVLTIGTEVNVEPLMVRTVQRLMYHTGFPVGLWLVVEPPERAEQGGVAARLQLAIGDYRLLRRRGELLTLPAALLRGEPALLDMPQAQQALDLRRPANHVLRLPVPGHGTILLLGAAAPATRLALPELFSPILDCLSRSITLCRSYEQEVQHRVERTAYYDTLTGLPNAILFNNTLQQAATGARAKRRWLALVHLDVDDFRHFNDTRGSEFANQALVALGQRLSAQLRPGELIARLNGDEFGLLLPDLRGWDDVDDRIVRILQTNRTPLEVNGEPLDLSFSAGIAVLPEDAEDGDTLARHAQMALHQAKQEARGYFRLFDAEQDKRTHTRRELLRQLDAALENHELQLFYQPKVDMPTGRIIGFEALLRWMHPQRGMVPPGEFLPMVENSDFIIRLGEWALRQALRQTVEWRNAGLDTCVSVNIAGRHLQLPDFAERVRRALADVPGARASSLEIEILESSVLGDFSHVRSALRECEALGVGFALDDFGTGYSSLAYLHQVPAGTIKIDQFFVRNLLLQREDPAIIRAVVQIAGVFGRALVAEGVEDPEHGMLLVCMGCRGGQGYGIARPMPAHHVLPWLAGYRPREEWRAAQALSWHPVLYDLFRHRYAHRKWREELERLLSGDDLTAPLMPHSDALAAWLSACSCAATHSLVQDGRRLLEQIRLETLELGTMRARNKPWGPVRDRLLAASDALLLVLDGLAPQLVAAQPVEP